MTPAMLSNSIIGGGMSVMHQIGRQLRKEEASTYNRLLSILHDSSYVEAFKSANPNVPILANLRCGQWYASHFDSTCYFKSTDGHCGYWKFNLRRFNSHVAFKAVSEGVVALVDSTRKGKRFPDSFSRTIPIWVSVINRAVYSYRNIKLGHSPLSEDNFPAEWKEVQLPDWISESERHQVSLKVIEFCDVILNSDVIRPTLGDLANKLDKPLKCTWICPDSHSIESLELDLSRDSNYWIVLLCPSGTQDEVQSIHPWYVQGSADDEETWALGLTAPVFWKHKDDIMASEDNLTDVIAEIMAKRSKESANQITMPSTSNHSITFTDDLMWIVPGQLAVAESANSCSPAVFEVFDLVINCSSLVYASFSESLPEGKKYMHTVDPFERGNNQKYKLSRRLPATLEFAKRYFRRISGSSVSADSSESSVISCHPLLIHGFETLETAIGLAIGVLATFYGEDGSSPLAELRPRKMISKALLKQYLLHVAKFVPRQLPSVMISDLNRFFISPHSSEMLEMQKQLISCVP